MLLFKPAPLALNEQGLTATGQAYREYLQGSADLTGNIEYQAEQQQRRHGDRIRRQIRREQAVQQAEAMGESPSLMIRFGLPTPRGGIGR